MTDKEKIKAEIERIMAEEMANFEEQVKNGESDMSTAPVVYTRLQMLLSFIDSMQKEEPVNDDLDKAAEQYTDMQLSIIDSELSKTSYARHTKMGIRVFCGSDIEEAIDAGALWKEQPIENNRLADCDNMTEEQAEIEQDFVLSVIEGRNSYPTYYDAIEYGMKLQRQQMLNDAVSGTVEESFQCQWQIRSDDLEGAFVVRNNLVDGDRVKLIVIKEE